MQLSLLNQRLARSIYFQAVLVVIMIIQHDRLPVPSIFGGFGDLGGSVILYVIYLHHVSKGLIIFYRVYLSIYSAIYRGG
jgi:hypothetical protein